ncbi:MAG TPA: methyltransferase domain-containing protein [Acidimicrobiales bacterium]|nr:methyltransferase domain-containing protein [Acidimicrobiales bacterium]
MTSAELREAVSAIRWYHRMDLPGGIVTPGVTDPGRALPRLHLPERLDGLSVLDIGAWDGFYSFECKRRGAARVLATDHFVWTGRTWGSKEGFLLARDALRLEVEDRDIDVMDISPQTVGSFDLVLLLGLLYHLTDPIGAIRAAASVTNRRLVVETETSLNALPFPAARLYPGRELNADDTNWWALNRAALEGLLREAGFTRTEVVYRSSVRRRLARAGREALRGQGSFRMNARSARIVVHAFR